MSKTATIIAVRDEDISSIPVGATNVANDELMRALPQAWAGPRPYLETDPTFRQVIPYVVVKHNDDILVYVRNAQGNEGRLHNKGSIGVGGHIDICDAVIDIEGRIDLDQTILMSARRELMEELGVSPPKDALEMRGYLKISDTEVDRVHFGVVYLWDLTNRYLPEFTFENTMGEVRWLTKEKIAASDLELEAWSKLSLALV